MATWRSSVSRSVLQFFVDSAWQLFLVRLLMGIAIGVEYSVGWPLMAEFAPARLRGRLIGVTEVAWYVGFMVAFLVGYVLTTHDRPGLAGHPGHEHHSSR